MNRIFLSFILGIFCGFFCGICFLAGMAVIGRSGLYLETSDSMEPVIQEGSLLFAKKQSVYRKGDIVVFDADYQGQTVCVTHRIVEVLPGEEFVMKGDANVGKDCTVIRRNAIAGKVTGEIRFYGTICLWIREHILFCLTGVGMFFCLLQGSPGKINERRGVC
ncbi:MAG: signal peptidase I [Lachnospiraceae bacterium]|nr:signal peptidase I [Lachnospiraceae bacterium]